MGADVPKAHGQRMRKLEHAYQRSVKYALRGIPPDDVFAYFPEGPLPDPVIETVYDAYRQTILQARSSIEVDFQDICDDNSIIDKLHTLDIMCAQQGIVDGASDVTVQGAPPTKAARAATLRAKKEEIKLLSAILEDVGKKEIDAERALEQKKLAAKNVIAAAEPVLETNLADADPHISAWSHRGPAAPGTDHGAGSRPPATPGPPGQQ